MDVVSDAIAAVHLGHPAFHRVRASGRWRARREPFLGAGCYVVLGGGCWLVPDGGGVPVALGAGDVALLPHGTGHLIADASAGAAGPEVRGSAVSFGRWLAQASTGGGAFEVLCGTYRLDCSRLHPLMAELPEVLVLPARSGEHPELRSVVDLLAGELDERRPGSGVALPSLLDLLLVYLVRSWMAEARSGAWPRVLGDPVTAAALRALHAEPAAAWSNERLAAVAGVSRATLARRFAALVGRPPMAYLTWWRLILAATRLRDTRDTLAAVAARVGYASPYALSHAFRREFGTTPGRYRTAERAVRQPR
ncbi:helix-turn-helix domain-containing protein [Streptomyces sp. 3MP-14]|uniref:Helix-turn-helix domain-containing protein n=1 Tax=Streptomyces mimosae TaxID=2586635 RepID=A0A5N6A9N7_9ACTN|nr:MULTISPECIES: AraC family transcriptional regulator [Streptomyces]KAB8164656.1 helix-turn-helix domain-containing protein [Streptomyces mimosae]KAB8175572.1 helix-turn-helix domain-containing protein [Streptomyces sp. 3MP-14]